MKVKICGLNRPEDIAAVNTAQPDYCGFIIDFPKSRRSIPWQELHKLRKLVSPNIGAVGVFVDAYIPMAADLANRYALDAVQLHGHEPNSEIDWLRERTKVPIWKAFQVKSEETIGFANRSHADFVLLDAGQGGGTAFDWSLLDAMERPFALAGGLSAENIPIALQTKAVLLDVSSGAETGGYKDPEKIQTIVSMIKGVSHV